jgi:hypothetical protein
MGGWTLARARQEVDSSLIPRMAFLKTWSGGPSRTLPPSIAATVLGVFLLVTVASSYTLRFLEQLESFR